MFGGGSPLAIEQKRKFRAHHVPDEPREGAHLGRRLKRIVFGGHSGGRFGKVAANCRVQRLGRGRHRRRQLFAEETVGGLGVGERRQKQQDRQHRAAKRLMAPPPGMLLSPARPQGGIEQCHPRRRGARANIGVAVQAAARPRKGTIPPVYESKIEHRSSCARARTTGMQEE